MTPLHIPSFPRLRLRPLLLAFGITLLGPASAAPSLWIADADAHLGRVDLNNGAVTVIGDMDVPMTDIAFDTQGRLFGVTIESALFRIDPGNAIATIVGELGVSGINSLVFGADGRLFAAGDRLYTLNPATGQASVVGNGGTPYLSSGDLAFVNGALYLSSGGADGDMLLRLNTGTGAATLVGPIGIGDVFGMATHNSTSLYAVSHTSVYNLNVVSAHASLLLDYGGHGLGRAYGTAFSTEALPVSAVPELPALPMLLAGLGCIGWLNRRRMR
jgi:hypothetical protein